ncbi:hypothetical protein CTR2_R43690 [Comamonas thiooxydans]|uniref:hypothetical protein n=1 Tax=Comamonas TaxID=283 RepID=UPI0001DA67BD|nr:MULTISPECIES: hypothetical protein [Comamonas]EFI61574.1 hypothetical protein CTS44_11761 [Comamonas thiooxydans]BDR11031.1 hypothetical protein CTR2_R43690 [Comamonas thiooxydans]
MPVQDDERERELVRMFNLNWDPAHQRAGVDAVLDMEVNGQRVRFDVEVKSSTGTTVSTARDVGMDHIKKWRRMIFVIGFYSKEARRPELQYCLCLTPVDMEPWIASIEEKISIDFKLAVWASRRLVLADLYEVCGTQDSYSIEDAKRLHKQQWTAEEYQAALDLVVEGEPRISPNKMLEILQLRLSYIAQRGATLNNPHITKTFLRNFENTNRVVKGANWAAGVRAIAEEFVLNFPEHPCISKI